jgi:hypothetical protein
MSSHAYFTLRRLSDDLVYEFDRMPRADGSIGYRRRDQDLWIVFKPAWGWVAYDETTLSITGRPWDVLPEDQSDYPPEGTWVSRKDSKSYVYELVYA